MKTKKKVDNNEKEVKKNTEVKKYTEVKKDTEVKFTKNQLKNSDTFAADVDILTVIMNDNETWSIDEAKNKIKKFKERRLS